MSLALLPEPSAVVVALQHLEIIGQQFEKDELGCDRDLLYHLAATIHAIKELEEVRNKTRERLEMETIKNSNLRFKVGLLPDKLNEEIAASILAARESNAVEINRLKAEIKKIRDDMDCSQNKEHNLETQNYFLGCHGKQLWDVYEQSVDHLNQQMAMKAQESINLNEIHNKMKGVREESRIIEKNINALKEEMIEVRKRFTEDLEELNEEIAEMQVNIEDKLQQNFEKQDYIDKRRTEYSDIENKVTREKETLLQVRNKLMQLQTTTAQLTDLSDYQKKTLVVYSGKREDLEFKLLSLKENFKITKAIQEKNIVKVSEKIVFTERTNKDRLKKNSNLSLQFSMVRDEEDKLQELKKQVVDQHEKITTELNTNTEFLSGIRKDIKETQEETVKFQESRLARIMELSEDMHGQKGSLNKERTKRILLQTEKGKLEKQTEFWKLAEQKILTDTTKRIEDRMRRRDELTNECISIEKESLQLDKSIELYRKEYDMTEKKHTARERHLRNEIKFHEDQLKTYNKNLKNDETQLKVKLPILQNLRINYENESKYIEEIQTDVEHLLQKKKSLEHITAVKKKAILKLRKSKEENAIELRERRAAVLKQVQTQRKELMTMEKNIYEVNRKLELAQMENVRLNVHNAQIREAVSEGYKDAKNHMLTITKIQKELETFSESLLNGWQEDSVIQKDFSEGNQETLVAMTELIEKIQEQEENIGDIGDEVREKCNRLSTVLDKKSKIKFDIETSDKDQ